jgi:hypothetical protein
MNRVCASVWFISIRACLAKTVSALEWSSGLLSLLLDVPFERKISVTPSIPNAGFTILSMRNLSGVDLLALRRFGAAL